MDRMATDQAWLARFPMEHLAANGRVRAEKANDPGETTFVRVE
jgi:hypothetical protein